MHAVIITPAQIPRRTTLAMLPMSSSLSLHISWIRILDRIASAQKVCRGSARSA